MPLSIIEQIFGKDFVFKPFVKHVYYNENLNFFEYIEEDCCTVTEHISGSNIELLRKWDGEKFCGIVGIRIWGFHTVAPAEVVTAMVKYNEERRKEWEASVPPT
jgi:hypothetical protein